MQKWVTQRALLCWARIAVSLALSVSVDALCHTDSQSYTTAGVSQARWLTAASSAGHGSECIAEQFAQVPMYSASGIDWRKPERLKVLAGIIIIIIYFIFYYIYLFILFLLLLPSARSLQAKNCKLGVVSNGTLHGTKITQLKTCFWMLVHFPSTAIMDSLWEKNCLQWFECNMGNSLAEFSDEFGWFRVLRSSCFYRDWNDMMCHSNVCCTSRFCLLLPCSLWLLRSLLSQQDEMRHMCRGWSRPMREAFHFSKGLK